MIFLCDRRDENINVHVVMGIRQRKNLVPFGYQTYGLIPRGEEVLNRVLYGEALPQTLLTGKVTLSYTFHRKCTAGLACVFCFKP